MKELCDAFDEGVRKTGLPVAAMERTAARATRPADGVQTKVFGHPKAEACGDGSAGMSATQGHRRMINQVLVQWRGGRAADKLKMFSVIDAGRLLLAVVACGFVVAAPGVALARGFGFSRTEDAGDPLAGVVVGLAVLPLLDSLATRFLGLDTALGFTIVLGVGALLASRGSSLQSLPRPWLPALLVVAWFVVVTVEWIDLDVAGKLFQPFTVIDTVKHAATTQAIVDSGAPPRDPFFLRPERASYYYFFYTIAALTQRLCGGLIDARAAVGGVVFWTGIGLYGLVRLAIERVGLERLGSAPRRPVLLVAILATGGLDILGVLRMGLLQGTWIADPVSWNEQVAGWLESLLWVPHHVTGLIAGMVGLVALSDAVATPRGGEAERRKPIRAAVLAALCFASAWGLSVWLALGLVTTVAIWGLLLLVERRWRAVRFVAMTGLLAILVATPQIADLHAGRSATASAPVAPTIRAFTPIDGLAPAGPWRLFARLVALPVNYFAGFGALASGAILFWRRREREPRGEFGRVLAIAAIAGLLLGAFLKSTLFNNDLGWRVVLFPLLAATVWTIAVLDRLLAVPEAATLPPWRLVPPFLLALLVLGWATSLYAFVSLRAYPFLSNEAEYRFMAADPALERGLRVAYAWADRNLPPQAVLQHDPTRPRAFAFALYGHNRTAVADAYGSLFGADPAAVDARIGALAPLFSSALAAATVRATAAANGIDDLVVTAADPVWSVPDSFVWRAKPVYASDRVRIIPVAALGG